MNARSFGSRPRIQMLDSCAVYVDGRPVKLTSRAMGLLCALVASGPAGASVLDLLGELYNDPRSPTARSQLRNNKSQIRKVLGREAIVDTSDGFAVDGSVIDIDIWHFLDRVDDPNVDWSDTDVAHLLATGVPYDGGEGGLFVETSIRQIQTCRRVLASRFVKQRCAGLSARKIRFLIFMASTDVNERLADEIVGCLAAARIDAAVAEIIEAVDAAAQLDEGLASRAAELGEVASKAALVDAIAEPVPSAGEADDAPVLPEALRVAATRPIGAKRAADADSLAADLLDTATLRRHPAPPVARVVEGAAGSGKTRFVAEVADRLIERGVRVAYIDGSLSDGTPFGALPLDDRDRAITSEASHFETEESLNLRMFSSAGAALGLDSEGSPRCVIVDDLDKLDPESRSFFHHLQSRPHRFPVMLVLTGAPKTLESQLDQASAHQVAPMTVDEALMMLDGSDIALVGTRRQALAVDLLERSGANPSVFGFLCGFVDEAGALMVPPDPSGNPLVSAVRELGRDARAVGVALAVLARPCSLVTISDAAELDDERSRAAVDELVAAGLLAQQPGTELYALRDQSTAAAFLAASNPTSRIGRHLKARQLSSSVHDTARHSLAAAAVLDTSEVVTDLLASGSLYLAEGSLRASLERFRAAEALAAGRLPYRSLIEYATVLHRVGDATHARRVRSLAHEDALAADDHTAAMDAALAGLPEAEQTEGELDRLHQLLAIDRTRLSTGRRSSLAVAISRQAALSGQLELASAEADLALQAATGEDQIAHAALCKWLAAGPTVHPLGRYREFTDVLAPERVPPSWRSRFSQLTAISRLEIGRLRAATEANAEARLAAEQDHDIVRQWHSKLLGASLHHVAGRVDEGRAAAAEAAEFSGTWAIGDGLAAYGTFVFIDAWIAEDFALMKAIREQTGKGMEGSPLIRAAAMLSDAIEGRNVR